MKEEKFNGGHVAMLALVVFVTLLFVTGIRTLNNQSGERKEAVQAVRVAEREKAAFIDRYHPRWFDVDLHGDASYVSYKIDVGRGRHLHTLMCEGIAGLHRGHWYVHPNGKCSRISSRKTGTRPKLDKPLVWGAPFYHA